MIATTRMRTAMLALGVLGSIASAQYGAWTGTRNIVLNTSATGANITGNVTKFPVLVRLTNDEAAIITASKPGGADIRFSKSNGTTPLPYQIDTWEPFGAAIWVLVDTVYGNNTTQHIKMYWGNPAATSESNGNAVFDTANGFVGVWHLGNAAGASPRPNSVVGAPTAQFRNAPITQQPVRGIIGMADSLTGQLGSDVDGDGNEDGKSIHLDMSGTTPYAGYANFTNGISYSVWVNPNGNYLNFERFLQMVDDTTNAAGGSSDTRVMFLRHTANNGSLAVRTAGLNTNNGNSVNFPQHGGIWKQVAFTKTPGNSSVVMYVDGQVFHTLAASAEIPNTPRPYAWIGRSFNPTDYYLNAKVDAPMLSKITRSADWMKLAFENQKQANTLANIGLGGDVTGTPYSAWSGHRTITLNTSATGANVTGNVTNFPVLIRLTAAEAPIIAASKAGGADLRFSKIDDATAIPFQIESWDSAGAAIWVKVDTVKGNNSTQAIRMHWGNPAATSLSNAAAVFDTANGFAGVWHMNGTGNETDATVNGNTATAANAPASAAGIIGKGRSLARATSHHFTVANHASLNWTTPALTLSAWVKAIDWEGSSRFFQKGQGTDGNSSQYGMRENSNDQLAIELNSVHTATSSASVPATGSWALIHARYNGAARQVYLNGAQILTNNYTANITTNTDALNIGRRPDGTNFFNGVMDELRVQNVARSTDWMLLEHENQKPGNSLVDIGTYVEPTPPGPPGTPTAVASTTTTGAITISWTAPANTGNAAITAYRAMAFSDSTKFCNWTSGALSCVITGLTPAVAYNFVVKATNSAGTGPASAASATVIAPTSLMPGSFVIRMDGANPYSYRIPASTAVVTDQLTMTITDLHGKNVWSKTIHPSRSHATELTWNGLNTSGIRVSAGMYVVRVRATMNGETKEAVQKGVTLKP